MSEVVSIEWKNLNVGQMLYVQTVVMPAVEDVLSKHVRDLKELVVTPKEVCLCSKNCDHCIYSEVCIERKGV